VGNVKDLGPDALEAPRKQSVAKTFRDAPRAGMMSSAKAVVVALHHAGVTVADMARSLAFYRDLLELEVRSDERITDAFVFAVAGVESEAIRIAHLAVAGHTRTAVELLEYQGVHRRVTDARPCDPGSAHVCLEVRDIDAVHRRLVAAGFRPQSRAPVEIPIGPSAGAKVFYASDPDGHYVEFFQPPPEP
jgi:catechol 2,3-dioxygenase-like lactoylglutathione lyase family enzyme